MAGSWRDPRVRHTRDSQSTTSPELLISLDLTWIKAHRRSYLISVFAMSQEESRSISSSNLALAGPRVAQARWPAGTPKARSGPCDERNELEHTSWVALPESDELASIQERKRLSRDLEEAAYALSKRRFGPFAR